MRKMREERKKEKKKKENDVRIEIHDRSLKLKMVWRRSGEKKSIIVASKIAFRKIAKKDVRVRSAFRLFV